MQELAEGREIAFGVALAEVDGEFLDALRDGFVEGERVGAVGAAEVGEDIGGVLFDEVANDKSALVGGGRAGGIGIDLIACGGENRVQAPGGGLECAKVGQGVGVGAGLVKGVVDETDGPACPAGGWATGAVPKAWSGEIPVALAQDVFAVGGRVGEGDRRGVGEGEGGGFPGSGVDGKRAGAGSQVKIDEEGIWCGYGDESAVDQAGAGAEHFCAVDEQAGWGFGESEGLAGDFGGPDTVDRARNGCAAGFGQDRNGVEVSFGETSQRKVFTGDFEQAEMALRGVAAGGKRKLFCADLADAGGEGLGCGHAAASL